MKSKRFKPIILIMLIIVTHSLFPQSFTPLYKSGTVTKVVDMTIGGETGNGSYLFSNPVKIAVDSKNNIYVLDYQESHIKKFSPAGEYLKTISGPGQGPGEILRCSHMTMLSDDRIVTLDYGNMRFSIFDTEGTFLTSIPMLKVLPRRNFPFGIGADDSGNLYIEAHTILRDSKDGDLYKIWQVSSDFTEKHIVDSCFVKDNEWIQKDGSFGNRILPFAPRFHWVVQPGGRLLTGRAADFHIRLYSPDRSLIKTFTHQTKLRRVTNSDKEKFFSGIAYNEPGSDEIKHGASAETRKNTKFPSHMPYFTHIQTDHEGNILCRTAESKNERSVYDIFSPEGTFINRITLPNLSPGAVFKTGFIYAIQQNEDGEKMVVKFHWE